MKRSRFPDNNKSLILLGHLSLIITAILAVIFYKERVIYTDPGQQLFEMINNNDFRIYANRYSMVINQAIPLLAIKIGLPLKYIAICYSLSFVLIYYLCFLISVYGFKNIGAGLGIALAPILIRTAFGHSISEAWLGVAYSAVFYALLNYYHQWKSKGTNYKIFFFALIGIVIVINFYIHAITLFTLVFSVGFTYFYKKQGKEPYIYIVGILVILPYVLKFLFPDHVHDQSFFEGIKMAPQLLPKLSDLPIFKFILSEFFGLYFLAAILIVWACISYARKTNLAPFLFSFLFIGIYIVIACLTFYKTEPQYSMESRLIPSVFMIVVTFIEIKINKKTNYAAFAIISLILIFSYVDLYKQVRSHHTTRIKLYEKILDKTSAYPERKFYIYYTNEQPLPVNSWGSAAETLLLSSLNGKENSKSIVFVSSTTPVDKGLNYWPCVFIWVPWYMFYPEERINKKYFDLKCTEYRELPYSMIEK